MISSASYKTRVWTVFSGEAFFLPPKEDFFSLKGVSHPWCALWSIGYRWECSHSQLYTMPHSIGDVVPTPYKVFFSYIIIIGDRLYFKKFFKNIFDSWRCQPRSGDGWERSAIWKRAFRWRFTPVHQCCYRAAPSLWIHFSSFLGSFVRFVQFVFLIGRGVFFVFSC